MQTNMIEASIENKTVSILVERKNIKTIRLKVYPESIVKISSPYFVSDEFLTEFVSKHEK